MTHTPKTAPQAPRLNRPPGDRTPAGPNARE